MNLQDTNQTSGEEKTKEKEYQNMASLLKEEGLGLDLPEAGEIKTGRIARIAPGQIMVSIGAKSEGLIGGPEFEMIPPDIFAELEVGQEIPVYIITPEDQHGNLLLSYVRALEAETWKKAQEQLESEENFTGKVVGYNRGGLLVSYHELRGFVPASLLSFSRRPNTTGSNPEDRFGHLMGEELDLQIIEVDEERRRLIFSERAALNETREKVRDQVIEKLDVGDVRTGRITSLADFGAFVNINGADGLVHLSEISWDRLRHPGDELKVGEKVDVKVISIDEEKGHIGLSIRQLKDDPWQKMVEDLRVGQLVEAEITRLTKFGAFAKLESGVEGLVHISELSEEHIGHPKEILREGDDVTLRIIKIEPESHRIGLSLRRVESLAYADMDMKILEEELEDSDVTVTREGEEETPEAEAMEGEAEEAAAEEESEAEAEASTEESEAEDVEEVAEEADAEAESEAEAEASPEEPSDEAPDAEAMEEEPSEPAAEMESEAEAEASAEAVSEEEPSEEEAEAESEEDAAASAEAGDTEEAPAEDTEKEKEE